MGVFKDYSRYYNLLYRDKNYLAEAEYVLKLVHANNPGARTLLNMGCGTGNHDFIFAEKGFDVLGADLSPEMVEIANGRKAQSQNKNAEFITGDLRTLRLNRQFDAVVSLFHVMSYQVSNSDLEEAVKTAHLHLEKGGVFVFDCWYGPGVLTDRPSLRDKIFEDENYKVRRISKPTMHPNDNCVDVEFNVDIEDKNDGQHYKINELHKMRYLFLPELRYVLEKNGFSFVLAEEWMSGKPLSYDSWNATIVCRK